MELKSKHSVLPFNMQLLWYLLRVFLSSYFPGDLFFTILPRNLNLIPFFCHKTPTFTKTLKLLELSKLLTCISFSKKKFQKPSNSQSLSTIIIMAPKSSTPKVRKPSDRIKMGSILDTKGFLKQQMNSEEAKQIIQSFKDCGLLNYLTFDYRTIQMVEVIE